MQRPIIGILRGVEPVAVTAIAGAAIDAGITRIEVPLNSPDAFRSIDALVRAYGSVAEIGAGTVLRVSEVEQLHSVGGTLVVSPNFNPAVVTKTKALGLQSWPGVMTPSECFAALESGADGLKLFPGNLIGPAGIKAMRAVLPKAAKVYAVGGTGPENFGEWIAAGADGFGIGSALYRPKMDPSEVAARAKAIVTAFDAAIG